MHPVDTYLTQEQARSILNINEQTYRNAIAAGVLDANGTAQCPIFFWPRLHNIVDLAMFSSIRAFGWPDSGVEWKIDYCFDIFDVLMDEKIGYSSKWFVELLVQQGSVFDSIMEYERDLRSIGREYVEKYEISLPTAEGIALDQHLYRICISALGICGAQCFNLFYDDAESHRDSVFSLEDCEIAAGLHHENDAGELDFYLS